MQDSDSKFEIDVSSRKKRPLDSARAHLSGPAKQKLQQLLDKVDVWRVISFAIAALLAILAM